MHRRVTQLHVETLSIQLWTVILPEIGQDVLHQSPGTELGAYSELG